MERDVDYNIYEKLSEKYGMSIEQAKSNIDNMVKMASEVGLDYRFDTMILTNTFDAHRLVMFAKQLGLMQEMTERINRAFFTESKHIGDHATLIGLAEEIGLNRNEVANMLESDSMTEEVRADEQEARQLGINSVPFFVINRKYAITGAQPTEVFVENIKTIIEQEGPFENLSTSDGVSCDEDGCEIPKK